jgi:hypothetical protein
MTGATRRKGLVQFRFRGSRVNHSGLLMYYMFWVNLILVSTLEDKGYEVSFCNGSVFVRPTESSEKMDKIIGV